jgi:hypothetical protein
VVPPGHVSWDPNRKHDSNYQFAHILPPGSNWQAESTDKEKRVVEEFAYLTCYFLRLYTNRPQTFIYKEPSLQLKRLSYKQHADSYPRTVTISLSESEKIIREYHTSQRAGTRKSLHHVREHVRRLGSGRTTKVKAHQRGDPNLVPRTITRVIP